MKSAQTERGIRSRDRLVKAAAELFMQRGVHGTSLDEILVRAGASKSQLYHYFANKQDLVVAVIEFQRDTVLDAQLELIDGATTPAGVQSWFDALVAYQQATGCRGGCPVGSIAAELADSDEFARAATDACFAHWRARITLSFERMRSGGILRPEADVEALAKSTLAAIEGGLLLCKSERGTSSFRAVLDAALINLRYWTTFD